MNVGFFDIVKHFFVNIALSFGVGVVPFIVPVSILTPTPIPDPGMLVARTRYSYNGYSVAVDLKIPKNGGKITGVIDGDCQGKIEGVYEGLVSGALRGKGKPTCTVLFMVLEPEVSFSGTISEKDKTGDLEITAEFEGKKKTETVKLKLE